MAASSIVFLLSCSHSGKRKKIMPDENFQKTVKRPHDKIADSNSEEKGHESLNALYQKHKEAVFLIYTSDGNEYHQGSGFFISSEGIGVSNYHVFEGTYKGREVIKLLSGQEFHIEKVLISDKEHDFILFKVDTAGYENFPFLNIAKKSPEIGESVFAIGNPKGLESTLSTGIVSSLRNNAHLIQTTAEITNGSSGGPLFNMEGEVIGITSSGMGEANLNFAIDIRVLNLIKQ